MPDPDPARALARATTLPPAPEPTRVDLARAAADALIAYCETVHEAAREVEDRGGKRSARAMVLYDRKAAIIAIERVRLSAPRMAQATLDELVDMEEGVALGCAVERWTLRLYRLAAEADADARDTAPGSEAAGGR